MGLQVGVEVVRWADVDGRRESRLKVEGLVLRTCGRSLGTRTCLKARRLSDSLYMLKWGNMNLKIFLSLLF